MLMEGCILVDKIEQISINAITGKEKMSEEISNKVKKIVADHLGIDEAKVTDESSFIDDLGADSLDTVELVAAFEEEFVQSQIVMLKI